MTYPPQPPILRLPAKIVQRIFLHLHKDARSAFLALRQASRLLRQQSEVVMFKRLKFSGSTFEHEIRARLQDASDGLAAHVTTVEMGDPMQIGMMDIMERLTGLRVLVYVLSPISICRPARKAPIPFADHAQRWAMNEHVPDCMLDFLHARPQIQLHVVPSYPRAGDLPLDTAALCSPSLHTLDTAVYTRNEFEIAALNDCLLKSGTLKNLTLRLQDGYASLSQSAEGRVWQSKPGHMNFEIESLTLDNTSYDWSDVYTQQCHEWLQSMNWGKLRTLDIAHARTTSMARDRAVLSVFAGRVPGLESLRLGFLPDLDHSDRLVIQQDCMKREDISWLLESVHALQELTLYTGEAVYCQGLEPDILQPNASNLKRLTVRLGKRVGWDASHFNDLRTYAPQLEELEVPIEMYQERGDRGEVFIAAHGRYDIGLRDRLSRAWHHRVSINYFPETRHRDQGTAAAVRDFGTRLRKCFAHPYQQQLDRVRSARSVWPTRTHFILASFPNLQHLKLRVHLRADSKQFIPDYRRGTGCVFIHEMAEETVTRLFKDSRGLKSLVVVFQSAEPSVVKWMFKVERRWVPEYQRYCTVLLNSTTGQLREL